MKIYIAGPMTGHPKLNFPAFDAAAKALRARGYDVVSPAELDDPIVRSFAMCSETGDVDQINAALVTAGHQPMTWGDALARDVKLIADEGIEAIVCLPGWEKSKGARLETFVGRLCGLPILTYLEGADWLRGIFACDIEDAHGPALDFNYYDDIDDEDIQPEPTLIEPEDSAFIPVARSIFEQNLDAMREALAMPTLGGEVHVTNATTGGQKGSKPQAMSLLPWDVLMNDVAPLYHRGALKYERDNWRKGYDWSLSFDALARHLAQFHAGQWLDEETQCPHLASVVFHACALMYFYRSHPELNDINDVAEAA